MGAPLILHICFVKCFEDSNFDASIDGANVRIPARLSISDTPCDKGSSGPMITRSTLFFLAQVFILFPSFMSKFIQLPICCIPALPGAQVSFVHFGFCLTAHAIECSRPPLPNIKICKKVSLELC